MWVILPTYMLVHLFAMVFESHLFVYLVAYCIVGFVNIFSLHVYF